MSFAVAAAWAAPVERPKAERLARDVRYAPQVRDVVRVEVGIERRLTMQIAQLRDRLDAGYRASRLRGSLFKCVEQSQICRFVLRLLEM